jgi:hypothetical protein
VELTRRGRNLWREMNVTYRRAVQAHFAVHLADDDIAGLAAVVDRLRAVEEAETASRLYDDDPSTA